MAFTFGRHERIRESAVIQLLLKKGRVILLPFGAVRYIVSMADEDFCLKVCFIVGKKTFRRANKRNLVRRRLREAWRLQKNKLISLCMVHQKKLLVAIIYHKPVILDFQAIFYEISNAIECLSSTVSVD
jgi:ribonuclease P protein component